MCYYCACVGDLRSFARSCSPISLPDVCIPGPDRQTGQPIHVTDRQTDGQTWHHHHHHQVNLSTSATRLVLKTDVTATLIFTGYSIYFVGGVGVMKVVPLSDQHTCQISLRALLTRVLHIAAALRVIKQFQHAFTMHCLVCVCFSTPTFGFGFR